MEHLFIYRTGVGYLSRYLVRSLHGQHDDPPGNYKLIGSIDPRVWLQSFLNYDKTDRDRMLAEFGDKSLLTCPFCYMGGFDDAGLKIHLDSGYCKAYDAIKIGHEATKEDN